MEGARLLVFVRFCLFTIASFFLETGMGAASKRPWNSIGTVSERHGSSVGLISDYFLSGMGPVSMTILQLSMVVFMTILYVRMVVVHMTWFSMSSPLLVRAWAWGGVRL